MNNKTIEVKENELRDLYNILTSYPAISKEQVQNEMYKVFGEDVFKPKSIMERVKTFEDACNVLGNDNQAVIDYYAVLEKTATKDIVAYMKLRVIAEALNEGWHPTFSEDEYRYFPWFYIYSKEEWDNTSDEDKRRCVGRSYCNAYSYGGLVFAYASNASSHSHTSVGPRLAFKTEELATYAGKQFIEIWANYVFA